MNVNVEELKIIQTMLLLVTSADVVQGKSLTKVCGCVRVRWREGGREREKGERRKRERERERERGGGGGREGKGAYKQRLVVTEILISV